MNHAHDRGLWHLVAAAAFALAAVVGLVFAVVGPVALMRLFGWTALVLGVVGSALQVYSLRAFHPATYRFVERKVRDALPSTPAMQPAGSVAHA